MRRSKTVILAVLAARGLAERERVCIFTYIYVYRYIRIYRFIHLRMSIFIYIRMYIQLYLLCLLQEGTQKDSDCVYTYM